MLKKLAESWRNIGEKGQLSVAVAGITGAIVTTSGIPEILLSTIYQTACAYEQADERNEWHQNACKDFDESMAYYFD